MCRCTDDDLVKLLLAAIVIKDDHRSSTNDHSNEVFVIVDSQIHEWDDVGC